MEKYKIFASSSLLLILANYWHLISRSPLLPRFFDYIAYGLFAFGIFKMLKDETKKS